MQSSLPRNGTSSPRPPTVSLSEFPHTSQFAHTLIGKGIQMGRQDTTKSNRFHGNSDENTNSPDNVMITDYPWNRVRMTSAGHVMRHSVHANATHVPIFEVFFKTLVLSAAIFCGESPPIRHEHVMNKNICFAFFSRAPSRRSS